MAFDKADRDRRHAVRLPHGLWPPPRQGRGRRADRPGLPDGRQEPGHLARPGRSSGRHPGRGRTGGLGPRGQPRQEPARLDGGAAGRGAEGDRQADALVPVRKHADPSLPGGVGDQRVPHRGHRLHRRRRRRGDDQRPGGAAAPARALDGPRRARRARHRHGLRHGGQARQSGEGGAVLLRRRLVRHDRVRHGDRQPVRRAVHRGDRQQLGHEPDPLRPAGEVRPGARRRRQQTRRRAVQQVCRDAGRLRRGGHRPGRDRPGAAARARRDQLARQVGRDQHLGGPNEYAPGTKAQTMYK